MTSFLKFIPIHKIDATRREVFGIVTSEAVDKDGEICDYLTTVPYYQAWSAEFEKATEGKSLGNVREMHSNKAAGKVISLDFDDAAREIRIAARIVDDDAWQKCEEGVYTGFSQGGEYVKIWDDAGAEGTQLRRYTAKPSEISLVDNPCNPEAHFEYVKADGSSEVRKFAGTTFTTEDAEDTEETQENQPGELFSSASSVSSAVNRGEDAEFAKLTVERDSLQSDLAKAAEECNTLRFNLQKAEDALRQVNERLAKLLSEPKAPKAIAKTVAISKDDDAAGALLPVKPEGLELLKAIHRGEI